VLSENAAFTSAVVGGFNYERPPDNEPQVYPYAVYHLKADAPERAFDAFYFQKFTLDIAAYVPQGAETSPSDAPGVQEAMYFALASDSANIIFMATALRNATELILHAVAKQSTGAYAGTMREGRDVFTAGLTVEFLCQGDRTVM
jgi:hypothetical protein